jgi:hypothetical protein
MHILQSPCSAGWLPASQQCFSLTPVQHQSPASQQYFSLAINQPQPPATSQPNEASAQALGIFNLHCCYLCYFEHLTLDKLVEGQLVLSGQHRRQSNHFQRAEVLPLSPHKTHAGMFGCSNHLILLGSNGFENLK